MGLFYQRAAGPRSGRRQGETERDRQRESLCLCVRLIILTPTSDSTLNFDKRGPLSNDTAQAPVFPVLSVSHSRFLFSRLLVFLFICPFICHPQLCIFIFMCSCLSFLFSLYSPFKHLLKKYLTQHSLDIKYG